MGKLQLHCEEHFRKTENQVCQKMLNHCQLGIYKIHVSITSSRLYITKSYLLQDSRTRSHGNQTDAG